MEPTVFRPSWASHLPFSIAPGRLSSGLSRKSLLVVTHYVQSYEHNCEHCRAMLGDPKIPARRTSQMSCANFIADGYTQTGYIQPVERLHNALHSVTACALGPTQRHIEAAERSSAVQFDRQARQLLAERLIIGTSPIRTEMLVASPARRSTACPELFLKLSVSCSATVLRMSIPSGRPNSRKNWPPTCVKRKCGQDGRRSPSGATKKTIQGMGLLLAHPRIVQQTCVCRQWVFDSQYRRLMRHGQPAARPARAPTPCITCVKKNPNGRRVFRSLVPYFVRLVRCYHEVVGTEVLVSLLPSGPSRFCIATWAWCMPRCGKPMRPKRPDNSISCSRKEPRDDSDSAISFLGPWPLPNCSACVLGGLDSGPQSADLLANLLPNRDPLPDGWLENFLAGTPVPGLSALGAITPSADITSTPNTNFVNATDTSGLPPAMPGQFACPPQSGTKTIAQQAANLREETLKCLTLPGRPRVTFQGGSPTTSVQFWDRRRIGLQ